MVGEWVARQYGSNCRIYSRAVRTPCYLQRVRAAVRICHQVPTRSLGCGWHSQNLGRSQRLPESLILHKIERAASAVIHMRQHDRPAIRKTELISPEWRNSARLRNRWVIEIIPRIESGVS